jgi:ribosomal protein S12 methylthiotransferase
MKIGFLSLGCPKNLVDSEVMLGLVQNEGHEITADPTQADTIIVNTCAFIDDAKEESIEAILTMAQHKDTGSCQRLIVTGCLAERYREELRREIPEIDAVLGTNEVDLITQALNPNGQQISGEVATFHRSRPRTSSISARTSSPSRPTYIYDATTPRLQTTPSHLTYVKIAEGCDYSCAFCIIPTLRGGYRSRPAASIIEEAHTFASRGVKELILISQDTTFYGVDRGERGALARLLRELNSVDGLEWIRLLYLYPTTIDDDTLDAIAACDKVCNYIDLPLQHASTDVLRHMGRPGNQHSYERLLRKIRHRIPNVAIRTTFIVGFPDETEQDFLDLCEFVKEIRFDHLGVFTYSHETGTRAHNLSDNVPAKVKQQRRHTLMALQKTLVSKSLNEQVGQTFKILVDGPSPEHGLVWQGRLASQAPEIDSVVYLTDCNPEHLRAGQLIDATIVGAQDYDLLARPLM